MNCNCNALEYADVWKRFCDPNSIGEWRLDRKNISYIDAWLQRNAVDVGHSVRAENGLLGKTQTEG